MTKIENEKNTVCQMIRLYSKYHLKQEVMSEEYEQLMSYACKRLDRCKFGENKTACKFCPIHCYAPKQREEIRKVMRWAGPRMIFFCPKQSFSHIFETITYLVKSKCREH